MEGVEGVGLRLLNRRSAVGVENYLLRNPRVAVVETRLRMEVGNSLLYQMAEIAAEIRPGKVAYPSAFEKSSAAVVD